jgi:carbon monoxide dehydrogenase subunit G
VLTDIELIAPCLPGAQLTEVDGDTYSGQVKVKVGPITAQYKGSAVFSEKDDTNHRVVLDAKGRDTRGQGNASAEVIAQLTADGAAATNVAITTDLKLSGKVAQFGRGVLADVSEKLLGEFQVCLEGKLAAGATGGAAGGNGSTTAEAPAGGGTDAGASASPGPGAATGPRRIEMPEPEPVDLLETAGAPVIKRVIPIIIVALVLFFLLRRLRRS